MVSIDVPAGVGAPPLNTTSPRLRNEANFSPNVTVTLLHSKVFCITFMKIKVTKKTVILFA